MLCESWFLYARRERIVPYVNLTKNAQEFICQAGTNKHNLARP